MKNKLELSIDSEIGQLEGVILHTPGIEVESMTPENAAGALYSDILNLELAQREYKQLQGVLNYLTNTYQVKDLLTDILSDDSVKERLISKICTYENVGHLKSYLLHQNPKSLASQLIEGVSLDKNNLTNFLSNDRFALKPLHNFFFTRDASITVNNQVLICKMASSVRQREAMIMNSIFDSHPLLATPTFNIKPDNNLDSQLSIEGGDVLIANDNTILIGMGLRTTSQAIDCLIDYFKEHKINKHIIVQQLPEHPESFIHLDMVFTFLDKDKCMIYEPLILKTNNYSTIHIEINNGSVVKITEQINLIIALEKLGISLKPILCGGTKDSWNAQREQWHSGANFFAVGPGKVIGYERNFHTIEELNKHGFAVIKAKDLLANKINLDKYPSYVITIDGSELSRGGGGCRCMTMPIVRQKVLW